MKIGIITQPLRLNYGGLLQNYALQTFLKRMGHEVITLDYPFKHRLSVTQMPLIYAKRFIKKFILRKNNIIFEEQFNFEKFKILSKNISIFVDNYINRFEVKNFKKLQNKDFDALIVGSDQVWRPKYNIDIRISYLNFAVTWKIKRIAYAISFGTSEWEYTEQDEKECRSLAHLFDIITVREDSGIGLCERHFDVNAKKVLDPTMLLTKKDYIELIDNTKTNPCEGNLFCYILDENAHKSDVINEVKTKLNLTPFSIEIEKYKSGEICAQPMVEQWLRSFRDAEFVIADSFHACVFSIIFNKPFICIGNENRGMTRFNSLLGTFGLENRFITDKDDLKKLDTLLFTDIDYKSVNEKLNKERIFSQSLLIDSLQ